MNTSFENQTAHLFSIIGNPFRIKLLLLIGRGEACVCHLVAASGQRQAYISQHLMALRKADLLKTRREGKYIYYQLSNPALLELVTQAGKLAGIPSPPPEANDEEQSNCCCPYCSGAGRE
ncbi:MAG: metalloregulator ArsR/SmtB family transcription factor [Chloroflexota bacterium]